jgi:LmbE family N-acetylglucosaminyl deacetylase
MFKNNLKHSKKLLLFTAHPDDHLCCAGLAMFLKEQGFSVAEVVFTGGERSVCLDQPGKNGNHEALKKHRQKELARSSGIIGIGKTIFLGQSDSAIARSVELMEELIKIIRAEKPQIVVATHPQDMHFDHQVVGRLVTEAVDRAAWTNAEELGESHQVLATLFMEGLTFGRPDLAVDITKFLPRKRRAVASFKSQITPAERDLLFSMNNFRGFMKGGVKAAEAYEIAPNLPAHLNELVGLFKK